MVRIENIVNTKIFRNIPRRRYQTKCLYRHHGRNDIKGRCQRRRKKKETTDANYKQEEKKDAVNLRSLMNNAVTDSNRADSKRILHDQQKQKVKGENQHHRVKEFY